MAAIRFELGADVIQFSKGIQYPVQKPVEKGQVIDRSAGNDLHVEELATTTRQFPIKFKGLPLDDYTALMHFHDQVCNGAEKEFTYFDEEENPHTVKMLTTKINFPQVSYHRFNGNLLLEVIE